jgi:hypothetical protein
MRLYDPAKDELLVLYWFLNLRSDPVEFENLFCEPLRNLTTILSWTKNSVSLMIDVDDDGIRFAAWCSPYLSGAEFGCWLRKDSRRTKAALRFISEALDRALSQYPTLMGLTRQPDLHLVHIGLGYDYLGEIPEMFDGKPARVYILTRQGREEAKRGERRNR